MPTTSSARRVLPRAAVVARRRAQGGRRSRHQLAWCHGCRCAVPWLPPHARARVLSQASPVHYLRERICPTRPACPRRVWAAARNLVVTRSLNCWLDGGGRAGRAGDPQASPGSPVDRARTRSANLSTRPRRRLAENDNAAMMFFSQYRAGLRDHREPRLGDSSYPPHQNLSKHR